MSLLVGELYAHLLLDKKAFSAGLAAAKKEAQVAGNGIGASLASAGGLIAKGMAVAAIGVGLVGAKATDMAIEFEAAMANVHTLIGPGSESDRRIEDLGESVKEMALETGKSLGDLTSGLYEVIGTFGDSADAAGQLEIAAKAGAAGLATTQEAISLLAAVTKSYGDTSLPAMQKASDLAFQTMNLGVTTFSEMAQAMGRVIPTAAALKVSQEELFAVMATLTGVTGNTDEVVTQLRGSMTAFLKPSREMKEALAELGYAGVTAGQDIIADKGLVGAIQATATSAAAGERGISKLFRNTNTLNAVFALTGDSADDFTMKLAAMSDASGATADAFAIQEETVAGLAHRVSAAFEVMMVGIGEKVLPVLAEFLEWVVANMPAISDVVTGAFEAIGESISMIATVVGPVVAALASLVGWLNDIGALGPIIATVIGAIALAFGAWAVSAAAAAVATVVAAAPVLAVIAAIAGAIFILEKVLNVFGSSIGEVLGELAYHFTNVAKGIVGTLLNLAEAIVGVAASIPGPWQDAAKDLQRELGNMRRSVDRWGTDTKIDVEKIGEGITEAIDSWFGEGTVATVKAGVGKVTDGIKEGLEDGTLVLKDGALVMGDGIAQGVKEGVERHGTDAVTAAGDLGADMGEELYDEFGEIVEVEGAAAGGKVKTMVEQWGTDLEGVMAAAGAGSGHMLMTELAQGIADARQKPLDEFETLKTLMKESMTRAQEIAYLIGVLTSNELAAGLKDQRPEVVAQAIGVRDHAAERLAELEPTAKDIGKDAGKAIADGLKSKFGTARGAAQAIKDAISGKGSPLKKAVTDGYSEGKAVGAQYAAGLKSSVTIVKKALASIAATVANYFQLHSPAKEGPLSIAGGPEGWGRSFSRLYSQGMNSFKPDFGAVLAPAGFTPAMAAGGGAMLGTAPASAQQAGETHYHYEVNVEGLVEAKNPFQIAQTLKRVGSVASRRPGLSEGVQGR